MKYKRLAIFLIITLLLLSTIASAGLLQDITGMFSFSLSKIFKKQILPPKTQRIAADECKISIDGKCANVVPPQLNMELQNTAKVHTLESKKSKLVSEEIIKASKTEKTITRNVRIGKIEKSVNLPVVNICINRKCKDYAIDETVEIKGIAYDLTLVKNKINLIPKGVPFVQPHEEDINKIEVSEIEIPPTNPVPEKLQIKLPEMSLMPPPIFKVGVIIDRDTVPLPEASREDIQEALRLANEKLSLHDISIRFELQDITELNMGGYDSYDTWGLNKDGTYISQYIDNYYIAHIDSPPNGVVILREDPTASSYGGYATASSILAEYGFHNQFEAPVHGGMIIYGSVIDFDHMYAACGYDDYDNRISDFPVTRESGGRECVLSRDTPCVFHNDYYMCAHIDLENDAYAQTRLSLLANTIIHEFLHSFHPTRESLWIYHYGNLDCPDVSCEVPNCFQFYSGMCPITWEEFKRSKQYYIPYSENCMPDLDRCSDDTVCEAWSAGNYRCSCLNNAACGSGRVCASGRCKIPAGGECDIRRADLCISGRCLLRSGERFIGTCA